MTARRISYPFLVLLSILLLSLLALVMGRDSTTKPEGEE